MTPRVLLVGEVFVDVTVGRRASEHKMRLGGVVHAARGLWAQGVPYSAAVCAPLYLEFELRKYLAYFGCCQVEFFAYVSGSPNVTLIFDSTETADQGYETLLREAKQLEYVNDANALLSFDGDVLIFPGTFKLSSIISTLHASAKLHIDAAYDVAGFNEIVDCGRSFQTIFLSTSSDLFLNASASSTIDLLSRVKAIEYSTLVLKENRGGSRVFESNTIDVVRVPAQLGVTVNSVGVGDVYDSAFVAQLHLGVTEAAWRAASVSTAYAYTTEPAIFRDYVRRSASLSLENMQELGGTSLTWEERQHYQIYLAAPDFRRVDRNDIYKALTALEYHNFKVRRPVQENGELPVDADRSRLLNTYLSDLELLNECDIVFAIPNYRDPGTLVEIGLAIAKNIPVVVYDSRNECANTMVISGASCYSDDLDACLNAVFSVFSSLKDRKSQ